MDRAFFLEAGSPDVERCIDTAMKRHGTGKRYYEEVHQDLAPLAREKERKLRALCASVEATIKHYDDLAIMWAGEARKRDHDDPKRAQEMAQSAAWRNFASDLVSRLRLDPNIEPSSEEKR